MKLMANAAILTCQFIDGDRKLITRMDNRGGLFSNVEKHLTFCLIINYGDFILGGILEQTF